MSWSLFHSYAPAALSTESISTFALWPVIQNIHRPQGDVGSGYPVHNLPCIY